MSNEVCDHVKLHIPKPPAPEFSVTIIRGGKPIECTLTLEEPPKFCSLTKDSDVLLHIYLEEVVFPLEILENTVKLTKNVAISFSNQRYTRLFEKLAQPQSQSAPLPVIGGGNASTKGGGSKCLDEPSKGGCEEGSLARECPAIAYAGNIDVENSEPLDVPIHIAGSFESDSTLSFNEIRNKDDKPLVIIKIEWRLSNKIGNDSEFDQVESTDSSLKLSKFMIGRFVKLTIFWSDKIGVEKNKEGGKVYRQYAVKGPVVPCQVLARDILIHSLTDTVVFNVMLKGGGGKQNTKYTTAALVFDKNNILVTLKDKPTPLFQFPVEFINVSLDNVKISLCKEDEMNKITNLHMNNVDIAILLFHVIIFRKFREKYKTIAQWEDDLSVGLYSDFNRIYSKILRTEDCAIISMNVAYGVESRKQAIRILDNQKNALLNQFDELSQDATEHRLVLEAINELPGNRRCFRLVGGVAVETTLEKIKPQLETESEKIKDMQQIVEKQLETINQQLMKVKSFNSDKN